VLQTWFSEPEGWLEERIRLHQAIRDDLLKVLRTVDGVEARAPQAGSYLFPTLPDLAVAHGDFVRILRHQAGIIVTPGGEFGPHSENSVRLNFSQDHAAAVKATERMAELVDRYRS
jgi:aspartate/methionine/tyrosine aminotransferase